MRVALAGALTALLLALAPASAAASFGFRPGAEGFDASVERKGAEDVSAGSHPDALRIHLGFNTAGGFAEGDLRDLHLALPGGFLASPVAVTECSQLAFHTPRTSPYEESLSGESCPNASQVGVVAITSGAEGGTTRYFGVFNLVPPLGSPSAIGFAPFDTPIELDSHLREADSAFVFGLENLTQAFDVQALDLTLWGTPWLGGSPLNPGHNPQRGNCLDERTGGSNGECFANGSSPAPEQLIKSYLTLPPSPCGAPMRWEAGATSWQGGSATAAVESHDSEGDPLDLSSCLPSHTVGSARLRTESAASATGLAFHLEINDGGGLFNEGGHVTAPTERAVVTLPEGLTINPSLGAGLGVCSEADFAREQVDTPPGQGCPNQSKIGTVAVEGLMGSGAIVHGSVYLAKPYENPYDTLLGLYIVVSSPQRGLFEKAQGKIEADPHSGSLLATFEHLPKLHYTQFELDLREGNRAALSSPATCGAYPTSLELTPWSNPEERIHDTSTFFITSGEGGGPCPSGGLAPFHPQLEAGSINPQAGAYTPFYLHMTRTNGEQEITSYSATFPKGLLGKIAGIPYCPDADIAAAKAKTGLEELEHPSCPEASRIGRTLAGYGVSGTLAYAPGGLYLAGPYRGSSVSIVAIDSALVGPFDLGVVVVRSAIRLDPQTARPSLDSSGSDPIPHILKGIPIHLRDVRVYLDRPGFMLNPTNCDSLQSESVLSGAGADVFSSADDTAATATDRFQVANCGALGFAPRLRLKLRGSTRRRGFPSLRAVYLPRAGEANIGKAAVALPHTEFLAQSHLEGVCGTKEFAAGSCPPDSVYGHARAFTPLLSEPLKGPVCLRSSKTHPLPDLVAALKQGSFEVDLVGAVDSTKAGGMRARFDVLPDAPVSKFVLTLEGGKQGLLENSADICAKPGFARVRFVAQDNATEVLSPQLQSNCAKRKKPGHGKGKGHK
jgi:hypothetical protein